MSISFDKDRVLHPELWNGCLRAFNPLGIHSYSFSNSTDKRGVYPDYASGKHGYIYNNTNYLNNTYVRPNVYKGVYCTEHFENSQDHITFPDTGLPVVAENVTLSMWLNPHSYNISTGFSIGMAYGDTRSGGVGAYYKNVYIGFVSSGLVGGTYASDIGLIAPWSEIQYKWIHVALTKSGTTTRGYVNGVLRASGTLAGSNTTLWGTGYIGATQDSGMRYPYIGYIGASAIHNRIVSDQEIRLLASDPQVMYEQSRTKIVVLSTPGFSYESTGGIVLGGDSLSKIGFSYESTGGIVLGGDSLSKIGFSYESTGGIVLGGDSLNKIGNNYESTGGLILGGDSVSYVDDIVAFVYESTGGLILTSNLIFEIDYDYELIGNLLLHGEALCNSLSFDGVIYNVRLDPYFSSSINYSFIFELNSSWDVEKTIEYDLDFTWDIGNQSLYWYTVEGICKVDSGCNTTGIPAGSAGRIYSRTVAARSLIDLCFKLNSLSLNYPIDWPVTKILRYKKPVYLDSINYVDDLNTYNLLENNAIVKQSSDSSETYINNNVVNSVEYFDKYTILLPDYRKIVKYFKDGILIKIEILEFDGSVKTYNQNAIVTIKAIPSSLININYKIAKQIKSLDINDNSGVLQEYCHIPECLSLCINEDLMVNIGCNTSFTDGFYDFIASGNLNLSGRFIYDNINQINFNGGLSLSGSSLIVLSNYNYLTSGTLSLGSSPLVESTSWKYSSTSNSLLISGNSICIGENLHYVSRGLLFLSGTLKEKINLKFLIKNPKLILSISSIYSCVKNFKYVFNGSLSLGSNFSFNSNAYSFNFNSGLTLSNSFLVKSNRRNYIMNSGFFLTSTYLLKRKYVSTGIVTLTNSSNVVMNLKSLSSGELLLGSYSLIKSTNFSYSSSGSLFISGSSDTNIINDLNLMINIGCQTNLTTYEPILPETYGENSFTFESGFITNSNCGCNPIPVTLFLNNNITTFSLLKLFLNRNNLYLSDDLEMHYNIVGKSWRHNVHFSSIDKTEEWKIVYDWSCDSLDSINVWNFSISITRRVNNQMKITKFIFLFDQNDPCNNENIDFNFKFNTNTSNIVYPVGLNLLKFIIKDDIGLCKDKHWQDNPLLKIKISENQNIVTYAKKDIYSIFP